MGLSQNPSELLRVLLWSDSEKILEIDPLVKGSPLCLISNGNSIPEEQASHLKENTEASECVCECGAGWLVVPFISVCVCISAGSNPYIALVMWSPRRTLIRPRKHDLVMSWL